VLYTVFRHDKHPGQRPKRVAVTGVDALHGVAESLQAWDGHLLLPPPVRASLTTLVVVIGGVLADHIQQVAHDLNVIRRHAHASPPLSSCAVRIFNAEMQKAPLQCLHLTDNGVTLHA